VRLLLGLVLLGASALPAVACPEGALCLTARTPAVVEVAGPASLPTPVVESPAREDLPWIWQVLRDQVYARLPRYEEARTFSFVLAPVVVKGSFDTVPGLGVAGDF
jgi:hypothetical protein